MIWEKNFWREGFTKIAVLLPLVVPAVWSARGQAPAAAPATAMVKQLGTVKSIKADQLILSTDAGQEVSVGVAEEAKVYQLAPGSTDLKTAKPGTLADVAVGDRVLAAGKAGDVPNTLTALRVILMKSSDIAERNAAEQADWQKRGSGGVVSAVDPATGVLTVTSGGRKVEIKTTAATKFRRYAGDSVRFEDAKLGTLMQIRPGDQLRVRGDRGEDGSIAAQEIVSGSFKNIAGTIATVDAANETITLKDMTTKKMLTVKVTANSDIRKLPEDEAAKIAARMKGTTPSAGGAAHAASSTPAADSGEPRNARQAGVGLAQLLPQLQKVSMGDMKAGDAVMIVASEADAASTSVTAVTMLTGVGPILKAMPNGSAEMTLSPWNMSGGGGEAGGGR